MTKPVTSVGVMMLYEQGKLSLDDPAGDYVPAIKGREVIATFNSGDGSYTTRAAASPVTIRQLLTHTSGLAYSFTSEKALALQRKGIDNRDMPLLPIEGAPPDLRQLPPGCRFAPRCRHALPACRVESPALRPIALAHDVACLRAEEALTHA